MARRGRGFSTKRKQNKTKRFKPGTPPRRQGQATQRVCGICSNGLTTRGLCSNRGCVRSYPPKTSTPRARDMRQAEGSKLWLPPYMTEKAR